MIIPPKNDLKECERCYDKFHINNIRIKETSEGATIYCSRCYEYMKRLEMHSLKLCKEFNININDYK